MRVVPYTSFCVSDCYFTKTLPNLWWFWWLQNLALHTITYMLYDQLFWSIPHLFFHNAIALPELKFIFKFTFFKNKSLFSVSIKRIFGQNILPYINKNFCYMGTVWWDQSLDYLNPIRDIDHVLILHGNPPPLATDMTKQGLQACFSILNVNDHRLQFYTNNVVSHMMEKAKKR